MKQVTEKLWISGQPSEADLGGARERGVRRVINNRPENEDPTQPPLARSVEVAAGLGMDLVHIPVVPGQITKEAVREFQSAVASSDGPVLAHCKSGMRSLSLWAIGEVLDGKLDAAELDAVGAGLGINLSGAKDWLRNNS